MAKPSIQGVLYCDSRKDWILHYVQDDVMRSVILRRTPKPRMAKPSIQGVLYCDSRNNWIPHYVRNDVMRSVILRRTPKNPVILAYCNSKNKSFHWGLEASSNAIFFFRVHPFNSFSRWIAKRISLYSSKYPSLSTPYCWVNPGIRFSLCSVTRLIISFVTPMYKVPFL